MQFNRACSFCCASEPTYHDPAIRRPSIHHSRVPTSGAVFRLCSEAEHLECVGILPFCDEFCEEMDFGIIHEKFGQALA